MPEIPDIDAPRGQSPDNDGGGLGADVAPHPHDHRDKRRQIGESIQSALKSADDKKRHDPSGTAGQEPRETCFRTAQNGLGLHVLLADPGHFQHILGGFLAKDVNNIVHRDNPYQTAGVIHDRDRQNIVALHEVGDFFLVYIGTHGKHIRSHELFEGCFRGHHHQLA